MTIEDYVSERVCLFYSDPKLSCVHATLRILAEVFEVEVSQESYDASRGMAGGGGHYGGQCGLIQGGIMFMGILTAQLKRDEGEFDQHSFDYSGLAEKELGSLLCREIRPEGFAEDNPPNLCGPRSEQSIVYTIKFVADRYGLTPNLNGQ